MSNLDIQIGLPQDFQGVEKDIIIISHMRNSQIDRLGEFSKRNQEEYDNLAEFGENSFGQPDNFEDMKTLNLALTRAKKFIWFVGNLSTIQS